MLGVEFEKLGELGRVRILVFEIVFVFVFFLGVGGIFCSNGEGVRRELGSLVRDRVAEEVFLLGLFWFFLFICVGGWFRML